MQTLRIALKFDPKTPKKTNLKKTAWGNSVFQNGYPTIASDVKRIDEILISKLDG